MSFSVFGPRRHLYRRSVMVLKRVELHFGAARRLTPIQFVITDPQADPCPSPTASSPDPPPRRPAFTRSGSVRYQESEAFPECNDKPSGKRKFKSKHLSDTDDQKVRLSLMLTVGMQYGSNY